MLVSLYRLLHIHCLYVSVTKPVCHAFSAWQNIGSVWSLKVTGKLLCSVVWHYHQSYMQHYIANQMKVQCVIASHSEVMTCQFGRNSIRSWQWPWYRSQKTQMCQLKVNIMSNRKKPMLTKELLSGWLRFVNLTISSWPHKPQKLFCL